MVYRCDVGLGQQVYLDNQGEQTQVLSVTASSGQQQQASSFFKTGLWIHPPQIFKVMGGVFIQLKTENGEVQIQVQGQNLQISQQQIDGQKAQQLECVQVNGMPGMASMPSLEPMTMEPMSMKPMSMGDMSMSLKPMQMQMGEMKMQMGNSASSSNTPTTDSSQRCFCTQCGQQAEPSDRFCSSCGTALRQ